jgi:asparagine synthase (glutamine-hydrolysing)
MCGIAGYYVNEEILNEKDFSLEKASAKIAHRGPDDHGYFYDLNKIVGLSHNRLSIIDTSNSGHQPMISQDENYVIIFNGEIYNFQDLRSFLNQKKQIKWKGRSDTEVLLNLYIYSEENKISKQNFFKKLNGIFSLAIWDKKNKSMLVARDSFGVKPLYYFLSENGFCFSSEIKSLIELVPNALTKTESTFNELDLDALNRYLTYLWCPGNSTPNKFLKKLEPGQFLMISEDFNSEFINWYSLPIHDVPQKKIKKNEVFKKTYFLLRQAVHRQMISDVPLGAFLSGGLDSSTIVKFARELNPNIACFSIDIGGEIEAGLSDDLYYAKKVANFLKVPLEIVSVESEAITSSIEEMIWKLDEPLADPAALNVFFISKLARDRGIKVILSGAGGDDIFSGYRRHYAANYQFLMDYVPSILSRKIYSISSLLSTNNFYTRRLRKYLSGFNLEKSSRLINYFKWIERDDLRRLYSNDFLAEIDTLNDEIPMQDFLNKLPTNLNNIEKLLNLEQRFFLCDHNLNYTDKMSMSAGVEVRVPFLDNDLVNYVSQIPSRYKQNGKEGKWVLKKTMENYLPKEIIYRPKNGFGVPLRKWLKEDLDDWLRETISMQRLKDRGLFNPSAVHELIDKNKRGEIDATHTLFSIACIEIWCNKFLSI